MKPPREYINVEKHTYSSEPPMKLNRVYDANDVDENETKLLEELTALKLQYKMLQEWVEQELKLIPPQVAGNGCMSAISYCSSCSCGKKERIESKG
jgi:hypothetical protein